MANGVWYPRSSHFTFSLILEPSPPPNIAFVLSISAALPCASWDAGKGLSNSLSPLREKKQLLYHPSSSSLLAPIKDLSIPPHHHQRAKWEWASEAYMSGILPKPLSLGNKEPFADVLELHESESVKASGSTVRSECFLFKNAVTD